MKETDHIKLTREVGFDMYAVSILAEVATTQ